MHCDQVRALCKTQTLNINQRRAGSHRRDLCGGLAVALDISRAFDTIPHAEINLALQAAEVPNELRQLVLHWICGAQYHVQGDYGNIAVDVCKGVRQGCVLSPLLYILVVARLHATLREMFGTEADKVLGYYADDTLFHAVFDSIQGLRRAICQVETLLETLTKAGLNINDAKTQVLLKLSGSKAKQVLRELTDKKQGQAYLRVAALWRRRYLPIRAKARYLGAQVSYESFEDDTVHHRLTAARAAFGRLRQILTSRSSLSLTSRVGLWNACIGTCLYYALDSSGITINGLQKVRVLVQKQLRAISRTPTHITHVSNQELLSQLGVEEPGSHILSRMQGQLDRWRQNLAHNDPIPVKAQEVIGDWRQRVLTQLNEQLQLESKAGRSVLQCPHCGLECTNKTVLGSHIAQMHAPPARPTFNRLQHSIGGMPRCSGCRDLFSSWARLQKHIEHGACPLPIGDNTPTTTSWSVASKRPSQDVASQGADSAGAKIPSSTSGVEDVPWSLNPAVLEHVRTHGWKGLVKHDTWRPKLAQWCCLCGTWGASSRAVKMHLARTHKSVWVKHKDRVEKLCKTQQADITVPCKLCGSISKDPKAHVIACPVLFQSILISFITDGGKYGAGLLKAPNATGRTDAGSRDGAGTTVESQHVSARAGADKRGSEPQGQAEAGGGENATGQPAEPGQGLSTAARSNGEADVETGGCTSNSVVGRRVYSVHQHRTWRHPSHALQHQCRMEEAAGDQSAGHNSTSADDHAGVYPHGTAGQGPQNGDRGNHEDGSHDTRLDDERRSMGLQSVGRQQEGLAGLQSGAHDHGSTRGPDPDSVAGYQGARDASQVPGLTAADHRHGDHARAQGGLLHTSSVLKRGHGGQTVLQFAKALRQHGDEIATQPDETGTQASARSIQTRGEPPTKHALTLQLRNAGNTCYINAIVHLITWLLDRTNTQVSNLGSGQSAWRAILAQRKAFVVHHLFPWNGIMRGWEHGGRQHDICEFFSHLTHRIPELPFQGTWNARVFEAAAYHVTDHGSCTQMITLDIPMDGSWQLQDTVNAWWGQAFIHALGSAPRCLALRLNRFQSCPTTGEVHKVRSEMQWCAALSMPQFRDESLAVEHVQYDIFGFAVHLGERVSQGHYRALLYEQERNLLHYCDDGTKAKPLRDFSVVAGDVYAVFLSRTSTS